MSIIYDALKKVQQSGGIDLGAKINKQARQARPRAYLWYILAGCLGLFIANIFFSPFTVSSRKSTTGNIMPEKTALAPELPKEELPKQEASTPPLESKEPDFPLVPKIEKPPLVLNGIFFSTEGGYALVNNRIVRVGDDIDGAIVKQITRDEVELESEGSTIKLSTNK